VEKNLAIDWHSNKTEILLNPRLPEKQISLLTDTASKISLAGHVWIATSGSHSQKLVALSKSAFLNSAEAVNEHLEIPKSDVWLNPLPSFHVGGLSIYARAKLSGSRIFHLERWGAEQFVHICGQENVALSALVPTQVHDLIHLGLEAPRSLRAIVIGGARLSEDLYLRARQLGWPLLPSFGMTECCSQIATAELSSLLRDEYPPLKILKHCFLKTDPENKLSVKSSALMTGYFSFENESANWNLIDQSQWLETEDFAEVAAGFIRPLGRGADFAKINGEAVSLIKLRDQLESIAPVHWKQQIAIATESAERSGEALVLYCTREVDAELIKINFNQAVAPFERIQKTKIVNEIPRSHLGKIQYKDLQKLNSL
jgi:O-succinylbenzoic acid--CoA ligase